MQFACQLAIENPLNTLHTAIMDESKLKGSTNNNHNSCNKNKTKQNKREENHKCIETQHVQCTNTALHKIDLNKFDIWLL